MKEGLPRSVFAESVKVVSQSEPAQKKSKQPLGCTAVCVCSFLMCVETRGAPRFLRSAMGIAYPMFTGDARGSAFAALTSPCRRFFGSVPIIWNELVQHSLCPTLFQIINKNLEDCLRTGSNFLTRFSIFDNFSACLQWALG